MTRSELLGFMRGHRYAVQASVSVSGASQAALVGIAVTDDLEIVFDSVDTTRKVQNIRQNPRIAFVIGGWAEGDARTVQYEGIADEPSGSELERLREVYFRQFPDGRTRLTWPGIVYIRTRPTWIRYSDYNREPAELAVFDLGGRGDEP
jgi:hypothetical protein